METTTVYNKETKIQYSYYVEKNDLHISISVHKGCPFNCLFCNMGSTFDGSINSEMLYAQIKKAIKESKMSKIDNLYVGFTESGEMTYNPSVLLASTNLKYSGVNTDVEIGNISLIFSTMMPAKNSILPKMFRYMVDTKNDTYNGNIEFDIMINSTDGDQRDFLFDYGSLTLDEISRYCMDIDEPVGSKYNLKFLLYDETIIDVNIIDELFDKDKFRIKLSKIAHNKNSSKYELVATDNTNNLINDMSEKFESIGWEVTIDYNNHNLGSSDANNE